MKKVDVYEKQASDFCARHGVILDIKKGDFTPITQGRPYDVSIYRGKEKMTVQFSGSQRMKEKRIAPTAYDILACLQKYDVGEFKDFCADFGYQEFCSECGEVNTKAYKIYTAVCKEYKDTARVFDGILEELSEIC